MILEVIISLRCLHSAEWKQILQICFYSLYSTSTKLAVLPLRRDVRSYEFLPLSLLTDALAPQVCRAAEEGFEAAAEDTAEGTAEAPAEDPSEDPAAAPNAPVIDWATSALLMPDVEKELYARFRVFRKKTRIGMSASDAELNKKAKRARKKQRKSRKAESNAKTDDRTADEAKVAPVEETKFEMLKATEDLERKLAKWYEDFAAFKLSQGGSFLTKNYTASAASSHAHRLSLLSSHCSPVLFCTSKFRQSSAL